MIRRYVLASVGAPVAHIAPVERGALDRTACLHIICYAPAGSWIDKGLVADGRAEEKLGVAVCRTCDRNKDADAPRRVTPPATPAVSGRLDTFSGGRGR